MADQTASVGIRDLLATSAAGYYYWATLHDATGGFVIASDTYTAGIRGELASTNGYTRGAKVVVGTAASCATTSGSPSVTLTNAAAIVSPGQTVSGTGIAGGTTVSSVTGNTITLSANATATGTVTLNFGTMTITVVGSDSKLDTTDAVWKASGGVLGPASYAALWVNSTNSITGAKLLSVKDSAASPQSSSDTQLFTAGIVYPLVIPTPA